MNEVPLLDVNVPMYAAGKEHPYREACAWIMTEIAESRMEVAIDTEIVQEVLYRYGALRLWGIGATMASDLLEIVPTIYPVTIDDIQEAIGLFREYGPRGVRARDCLHAAVMRNNGLSRIISTDGHFDLIEEITRLDPKIFKPRHSRS